MEAFNQALVDLTADAEYLRKRTAPRPGDSYYLHLRDILDALQEIVPRDAKRVLDYGCGGSPYRELFSCDVYNRADLAGAANVDFEFMADARLPDQIGGYDCVLSTQVLEHVQEPNVYLSECFRVLRPGGSLVLTTHGLFEDHATPYDYWRWTGFGLKQAIETSGFKVSSIKKLTTGPRAILTLLEPNLWKMRFKGSVTAKLFDTGMRVVNRIGLPTIHKIADDSFKNCRVVPLDERGHDTYVALAVLASR